MAIVLAACSGSQVTDLAAGEPPPAPDVLTVPGGSRTGWPASGLPLDFQQPWEKLDGAGLVVPESAQSRDLSAVNLSSEFRTGVDRFSEAGDVSNLDQASSVGSGTVGSTQLSHAVYRLPMGAGQPGVVSVDVNLRARSDGSLSDYWLGISDYVASGGIGTVRLATAMSA